MTTKKTESVLVGEEYQEYLKQIGRITANFGVLELTLMYLFNHLCCKDMARSTIVYFSMANRARFELMKALADLEWNTSSDAYQEFHGIMENAWDAICERNAVSHCQWAAEGSAVSRITLRSKGGKFNSEFIDETPGSLRAKGNKLGRSCTAIRDFLQKYQIPMPSVNIRE